MKAITLREARRQKGWTQVQLAEAAGIDQTTVSTIERGAVRNPSWDVVRRMSKALGVRPEALLFGVDRDEAHA